MRAGKITEAQTELIEKDQIELYEQVAGGEPFIDNSNFVESDDFGEFIPNENERASCIYDTSNQATSFANNVTCGNRTNLLFIDTCLEMIKENQRK